MDSLFGVPLTSILIGLLILLGLSLAVVGWVWVRQPILFRMGIRNLGRRPAQTTLIVVGLTLSTLIVSAAFATGDTVGYSITSAVYDSFEEIDLVVAHDGERVLGGSSGYITSDLLADLHDEFAADPDVDAITGVFLRELPALNSEARLSEPRAVVVGVDPATIDPFQALRRLDGGYVSAQALTGDRVFISRQLAEEINAEPGSGLQLFAGNEPYTVRVLDIVQDSSLTGIGVNVTGGGLIGHIDTMRDLRSVDCDLITVGQYLRPSEKHTPLSRWYMPDEFEELRKEGEALGFKHVASGPLVRSSYHADEQHEAALKALV